MKNLLPLPNISPDILRQNLELNGYIIVDTSEFNISARLLSEELARFIQTSNIDCIRRAQLNGLGLTGDNLGQLISEISLRESNNSITSRIYEMLPSVPAIYAFAVQTQILTLLATLGLSHPVLGTVPLVRIDRPGENKFQTPWHQDSWFSFASDASLVIWIPLGDINIEQGQLVILPGSHQSGILPFRLFEEGHEPFCPLKEVDESLSQPVPVKFGEMLVFKQTLLHKSGKNISNSCRVSMQLRFNDMYCQTEPFSTFTAKHSDYVVHRQTEHMRNKASDHS